MRGVVLGLRDGFDDVAVEPFMPGGAVVALDASALLRLSGLYVLDGYAPSRSPNHPPGTDVFRAIVPAHRLRQDRDDLRRSVSACLPSKSARSSCRENSTYAAHHFRGERASRSARRPSASRLCVRTALWAGSFAASKTVAAAVFAISDLWHPVQITSVGIAFDFGRSSAGRLPETR